MKQAVIAAFIVIVVWALVVIVSFSAGCAPVPGKYRAIRHEALVWRCDGYETQ